MSENRVEWLCAQLNEDERVAQEAGVSGPQGSDLFVIEDGHQHNTIAIPAARVLRQVERDRRVLNRHTRMEAFGTAFCSYCCTLQGQRPGNGYWPCPEIIDATLPYADRPGYRTEWGPQ